MINVLINAYAVSPNWGSEPGMGWNWIINIANHCNVYVITESEWEQEIITEVNKLPQKDNIHFYFNSIGEKARKMCWNQGDWRFYWYYRKWQKKTLKIAQEIIANHHIDIIHQLNMIGFREPGYLWKIPDIPIVWGPVGGLVSVPKAYRTTDNLRSRILSSVKDSISDYQINFGSRVRRMIKRSFTIAAVKEIQTKMQTRYGKSVQLINETGTYLSDISACDRMKSGKFNMLWVGRLIPTKRLDIALNAIKLTNNPNIRLTICGVGTPEEEKFYLDKIKELGISKQINWLGKVNHEEIENLMANSDLFFFTSVVEATSTVIVEAISVGLPILSFNACGFGPLVKSFAGETIELSDPDLSATQFADKINYLYSNPNLLKSYSDSQKNNRHLLSWEYKGRKMMEIYSQLLNK